MRHYLISSPGGAGVYVMTLLPEFAVFRHPKLGLLRYPARIVDGQPQVSIPEADLGLVQGLPCELEYRTPESEAARWTDPSVVDLATAREVPKGAIPQDRTFRAAWRQDGATIETDMPHAREIWKQKMRVVRKKKLEELDAAYMRADEAGDTQRKRDIAAQKQALRDVTADPRIAAATTPEELKAVWPEVLK